MVGVGMPFSELKREVEGSERVIESVELIQDEAAIDEGLHMVRASEEGILERDESVIGSADGKEGSAFGGEGAGVARFKGEGAITRLNGFSIPFKLGQRRGHVGVHHRQVFVGMQRLLECSQRLLPAARPA